MDFAITQEEWASMTTSSGFGNSEIGYGIGWNLVYLTESSARAWIFGVDTASKLIQFTMTPYLDGKVHSFVITYSGTIAKIFVDGKQIGSVAVSPKASEISSSCIFNVQNFYGKLYEVRAFNFDMSAEDAPYTVADYAAGKSVPLSLRKGGGEVLELADSRSAYQIKDLSGSGNHATIFGEVLSRYNENPTAMQVEYTWGSDVSTGAYIMGDTVTLPANSQVEVIGYSSTAMTLSLGTSPSASTTFADAASIGTTPTSICTFYTGSSAQKLYATPSVAGATINLAIKVTQVE